jgi:vacuolar-type H+-ATPase subunit E/Vma4
MRSMEESMEALSRAALGEARADAERILTNAKAKVDAIHQRAQEQAKAARKEILERAQHETERIRSQAVAAAQLQARTLQLERREKLLDAVFGTARQRLTGVQQWTEYPQIVRQLVRESITHLEADQIQIQADERTTTLLTEELLKEIGDEVGVRLTLGAALKSGTGIVAETEDGRRRYDNRLEARLSRLQDSLRAPVYRLLMGESL